MFRKMIGIALIVLGDVALIVALAADAIGLGAAPEVIGWKQISLVIAAIFVQLVGLVLSQVDSKVKA